MSKLHDKLVEKQSTAELQRKAELAIERSNLWTQEEIDLAKRKAQETAKILGFDLRQ